MKLILISGKRFNGKDTLAKLIQEELARRYGASGGRSLISSFADELKRVYCRDFGIDLQRLLNDREFKEAQRDGLTKYFTYLRDLHGEEYYAQLVLDYFNSHNGGDGNDGSEYDYYIIPDLRLVSHLRYMEKQLGELGEEGDVLVTIRLEASDEARQARGWVRSSYDDLPIECQLDDCDDFDIVIKNNDSLEALSEKAINLVNQIIKKMS